MFAAIPRTRAMPENPYPDDVGFLEDDQPLRPEHLPAIPHSSDDKPRRNRQVAQERRLAPSDH